VLTGLHATGIEMLKSLGRTFRQLSRRSDGNTAMLMAIGMPALLGAGGMAVDVTQWYLWKRELQHAVDQAAIGAAWALSNNSLSSQYQTRGQQEFSANVDKVANFASTPTFALANYSNGTNNSVIVTATASAPLPFSRYMMGSAAVIRATAQASFAPGTTFQACLQAIGPTGTTFKVSGNAKITANCDIAAHSCSDPALTIDDSTTVNVPGIRTCGSYDVPDSLEPVASQGGTFTDAFASLSPPSDPNAVNRNYDCPNGSKPTAQIAPGVYSGLVVKCTTTLSSGIYVIDGGVLDLAGNYMVTGSNVIFVLKNGAQIKLGGNGSGNQINLTPPEASLFTDLGYSASQASKYANVLIFEDRNGAAPGNDHIINGNSDSVIKGTVYLPKGNVRINGTANIGGVDCLQISAKTIDISGDAELTTQCSTSQTNTAGSVSSNIRLVA
jgi:Flp pilus assembly protein TadG